MSFVSRRCRRTAVRAKNAQRAATHFLKHGRAGALVLGLAAAAAVAVPASASASASSYASPVVGHVYVNDNTKGTNTVGAFDRHADGTLTPEAGSPFAAGGAGTGAGLASQGAIQITPGGRFLIAADAGSNQVSVLRIGWDGSLALVPGGVVSSGGVLPVSIAVHGDLVYVANAGPAGSNFTGFRLGFFGQLRPIPGSTVALSATAQPGDVLFNGDGSKLAGTLVGTSQIASFTVGFGGRLTAAPGSPFPAQGLGPFGSEFRPAESPPDGTLTLLGSTPVGQTGGVGAVDARLSPDGRYLFVDESRIGAVGAFAVNGGNLTELATSPTSLPAGAAPAGIVVN